jgi:hypothetical protein
MPRPKCPRCSSPLSGSFFRTQCENCGTKLGPSGQAWRDLAISMAPAFVLVGFTVLASRHSSIRPSEIFRVASQCIAVLIFVLLRDAPVPDRTPQILELLRRPTRTDVPIPVRELEAPLFETPKSWRAILSSPRPRKLKSSIARKITFEVITLLAGVAVWIAFSLEYNWHPIDRGLWNLLGLCWFVVLIYGFITSFRNAYQSRRLLRDGEATIGRVTDAWETGGESRKVHITVQFRDLVGRLFEHDFVLRRADNSADPGHPALVFYDSLYPERCTISAATTFRLAEKEESFSAARAG